MKRSTVVIMAALSLVGADSRAGHAQRSGTEVVTVAVVIDGPYPRHQDLLTLFRDELRELLSPDFDLRITPDIEGDWTLAGVEAALDRALADADVDVVLTLGAIGSYLAASRRDLPKPVVAPIIINPQLAGLPAVAVGSGIPNLSYVEIPEVPDVAAFLEIVPFTRIAFLGNGPLLEAIPGLAQNARQTMAALGLGLTLIPVERSADTVLTALAEAEVEAVYVLPQLQLDDAEWQRLVQGLIELDLPSFSWAGEREVREGVMAGRRPDRFWQRLARRVALNVQRILLGEDPSSIPVEFPAQGRLTINMATARAIQVYPPWKVITEAELIDEERRTVERELDLVRAVREAIAENLDLAAEERRVNAGAQEVHRAWSSLLPQVQTDATYRVIDEDRAESSLGALAERQLSGSVTLSQVIFAEPAYANVSAQRSVQRARMQDRETLRLDIARDAAVAYLSVLKAKTFERIERENLRVTRENLELAEIRQSIGTAGPGEVYRWQNQIANNRQAVINANARRNLAEIELNRVLHRPLEESFSTQETDLTDPVLLTSRERLFTYIDDPWSFRVFRRFMAQEALGRSPELRALGALAAAQRRFLRSAERDFLLPRLALQASVTSIIDRAGSGANLALPAGFPTLPQQDDLNWSLGVSLSYPLFTGTARFAERSQAAEELARIETEREAVAERVEQRARAALHRMGASRASIGLSQDAAVAARNNFELVQESYSRGAADVIQLLDAQNASLVAEQVAANAVYDFLIDLMNVERAVGRFYLLADTQAHEAFFQRLEDYFRAAGEAPRP